MPTRMPSRQLGPLLCAALLLAGGTAALRAALPPMGPLPAAITDPAMARADYVEQCAGCHGVAGSAAPAQLPELRGRVGWFLCTPQARAYLIRLPNVAHSRIRDNQQLADMMNYVVFGLGGASAPSGAAPFTAEEVARERRQPLSTTALKAERARHVETAIRHCNAPTSLRLLYPGQKG
ncbi:MULTISPECIES: cytochrome C [unclassified Sphingobium]|uniref:cytochrome C n=1 Tax=unclassified Sphingobium TaxID=2611147 RepID=UPI000A581C64|nr:MULTISPECIES: cytochrome C [unclassified Sphingobium]WIW87742.1 cytochrome C [Sphingobium sp. V4]